MQAPDYLDVIEKPMDLSIVLRNLDELNYEDVLQFTTDVKLVFENAKKYNTVTIVLEWGRRAVSVPFCTLFDANWHLTLINVLRGQILQF